MLNTTPSADNGSSHDVRSNVGHAAGQNEFPAPIGKLLRLRLSNAADGHVTVVLEADERYANPMGTLRGGVLCDVADAAMGAAYRSITGSETLTTLEQKINFLRRSSTGTSSGSMLALMLRILSVMKPTLMESPRATGASGSGGVRPR